MNPALINGQWDLAFDAAFVATLVTQRDEV